ncbi:MAG: SDR family NAD(P)-dependent oxidoreductase, partial [Planctomycetota bacterium]
MSRPGSSVTFDNQGRVVIVTGGGQGIGLAIVNEFCSSGATVIVAEISTQLESNLPSNAAFRLCNTSKVEDCERVVEETVREYGGL